MKIADVLQGIEYLNIDGCNLKEIDIKGLSHDSRDIEEGYLFVAIKGYAENGHKFIDEAISRGAVAVLGVEELSNLEVPYLQTKDTKSALGVIASQFYHHPFKNKKIVGVTGTNGKTTTTYMVKSIFEANGYQTGIIGTIQNIINGKSLPSRNTTPSAVDLYKFLYNSDDEVIVLEVSSHALNQSRVAGIPFDVCLFTNLEGEHLDYHNSIEEYFETKYKLFKQMKPDGLAVVNFDDDWGKKVHERLLNEGAEVKTVGIDSFCDACVLHETDQVWLKEYEERKPFDLMLPGLHNQFNGAMSLMVSEGLGLDLNKSLEALRNFSNLPGRFETVDFPGNKVVVIDYAHTANGIYHCLKTARESSANQITHVFGFRGKRDESKREMMLENSRTLSDKYVLTLDDLNGVKESEMKNTLKKYVQSDPEQKGRVIIDRTQAIKQAIEEADDGSWIVITGKGHEEYQQTFRLGTRSDFDTVKYLFGEHPIFREIHLKK
ncbi:UDP-N-acetylmuramoyl-L-alanyl-D-glutamate--2,6-diaminopimelate ligase [Halalkalibacillus sediminis]|uniref:UDP-N-acetylmuramoyl-L-alanyl-D-glutamate--2, 6-diaminopimelate ligase n=1 Tax=Halalkalibacillus sediminis TaxID=2018042 RepID=UPI0013903E54|nr:UDP-N-acetylmuramoyl-L-alanyl-D-glutamate--2,6-diaminopimelate ligase [Halalkalibacillus sediminis]